MNDFEYISYQEWGRRFFEVAVTEARVASAFHAIAGDQFEIGPMAQGPGRIAKVHAKVKIREPQATSGQTCSAVSQRQEHDQLNRHRPFHAVFDQ